MTHEEKDLLIKDLCARLPYGVILNCCDSIGEKLTAINKDGIINHDYDVDEVKPYLFPLSSMTEEQENEWYQLHVQPLFDRLGVNNRKEDLILQAKSLYIGTDWLNANHFDYRGLIPMGLAINATNLNIY